jgi:hypothetical protein
MMLTLRIKHELTTHYVKIAAVSLVFIGICTVLLLTNIATPALAISPYAEEPQPDPTTHRAGVSQAATVTITNTTDAFTAGETLEDRSVFPLQNASAPVMTVDAEGQDATVNTITVRIIYTASTTGGSDGRFYASEETIAKKSVNGASGTLETVVDIQSVFERKTELEAEFGSGVTVVPAIESTITYHYTSLTGQTQRDTVSVGGDITAIGELYSLPRGSEQELQTMGPPAIDATAPLLNAAVGVIGGAFVLLSGTALLIGRRNGRKKLGRRLRARRYDEWVTEIDSYTPRGDINVVQVETLVGLVNLAIDVNERVLHTPELEEYIVMDDDTMYKYRSKESDIEGGSEFFGFSGPGMIPDESESDTNGTPMNGLFPDDDTGPEPAAPDSAADSDSDAGDEA